MADWNDNHSLDEFGATTNESPPRMRFDHSATNPGSAEWAGVAGPMPNRDVYGFALVCSKSDRLYGLTDTSGEAHAIFDEVLSKARSFGAQRVLAIEQDTSTVWEWPMSEWKPANSVPKRIRGDRPEQTYALLEHATEWGGHADGVEIEADELTYGHKKSHEWPGGG